MSMRQTWMEVELVIGLKQGTVKLKANNTHVHGLATLEPEVL
jgi:hypothetical protein